MKKSIISLICSAFLLFSLSDKVNAFAIDRNIDVNNITFFNPQDSVPDFSLLTGEWDYVSPAQNQMCNATDVTGEFYNKSTLSSVQASTGNSIVIDGMSYTIFKSNVDGIGWIMGVKDRNAKVWTALTTTASQVFPFSGSNPTSTTLGAEIKFSFVKIPGKLPAGAHAITTQQVAQFNCTLLTGQVETARITLNSTTINIASLACRVTTDSVVPVTLGSVSIADLAGVNQNFGNKAEQVVGLTCDRGVIPAMTISDTSNYANTTDVITLSPDSTASGIGVQAFYNGQAKRLGLDSSSKNNPNQIILNNGNATTVANQNINVPLAFQYIQISENVIAGSANAAASITFSYQ